MDRLQLCYVGGMLDVECAEDGRVVLSRAVSSVILCMQNWPSCAEITERHRNGKVLQVLLSNTALSLALAAATASATHFGVKVIK